MSTEQPEKSRGLEQSSSGRESFSGRESLDRILRQSFGERLSFGGAGSAGGSAPDRGASPDPSDLPETLTPTDLVEVVMDEAAWTDIIKKLYSHPLNYELRPQQVGVELTTDSGSTFRVEVKPMGARSLFNGSTEKWPLTITFTVTNPASKSSRENEIIQHHIAKGIGESLGWQKLSQRQASSRFIKVFQAHNGSMVTIDQEYSTPKLTYDRISADHIADVVKEIRALITRALDFALQILAPHSQDRRTLELPTPIIEPRSKDARSGGENRLTSGFSIEDCRVEVAGFNIDDLGGNKEVKNEIQGLIDLFANLEHFRKYGLAARPPRGILLEGPPGTGKTLAAQIIAASLGLPFYELSAAEMKNMWVGESAKIVQSAFEDCETPCVLFFDEIDVVGGSRDNASGVEKDIMQGLLKGMQGLDSRSGIIVIGATNNAEMLDRALTRSGRFDRRIHVGLPDLEGRAEIFSIHYDKVLQGVEPGLDIFAENMNSEIVYQLAAETNGFSGADIAEIFRRSVYDVARRALKDSGAKISMSDLLAIIETMKKEKSDRQKRGQIGFRSPDQGVVSGK